MYTNRYEKWAGSVHTHQINCKTYNTYHSKPNELQHFFTKTIDIVLQTYYTVDSSINSANQPRAKRQATGQPKELHTHIIGKRAPSQIATKRK